jgi:AraC-like DNA-binding protein
MADQPQTALPPRNWSARGVLRRAIVPGEFQHARVAPAPTLDWLVERYWSVRWDVACEPQPVETLPHPNVQMVFEAGLSGVYGVAAGRYVRTLQGQGGAFGVKFRPGGFRPFLDRQVSELADTSMPITRAFTGAQGLEQQVLALSDPQQQAELLDAFLQARLPSADDTVVRVTRLVDGIAEDRSITQVEELVRRYGINKRALQRLFSDYVGASPKWVINRYRIHESLEHLASGRPPDWATLALDLGYFDQAHFIRDFKALVGQTPSDYAKACAAS